MKEYGSVWVREFKSLVGVHGFSVYFSWQFHYDKIGVSLAPDRHSFETCLESRSGFPARQDGGQE